MSNVIPQGTALYLRKINPKRHGTPDEFAQTCLEYGLGWAAIAGPWHDAAEGPRFINLPRTCRLYADALAAVGIIPWIWGYPWQGTEEQFAREMRECSGDHMLGQLDPELGSNPTRSKKGRGKRAAEDHAYRLVEAMSDERFHACGLSTFGSGWRMGWFPLLAFTRALLDHFRGSTFIGGQTYTDNNRIDMSIGDMITCIREADPRAKVHLVDPGTPDIAVVPNFGSYKFLTEPNKKRKAVPKTPEEFRLHLYEFINEDEPVDAVIGWAENFMNAKLWNELGKFGLLMERGATKLK